MIPVRSSFLLLWLLLSCPIATTAWAKDAGAATDAASATAPTSPQVEIDAPLDPDRYVRLYERILSREQNRTLDTAETLWLADVAARLARLTNQSKYREKAVAMFESTLADLRSQQRDFHVQRALGLLVNDLRDLGLAKPAYDQALRSFAEKTWRDFLVQPEGSYEGDVDHNIRLAQAYACAAFIRYFKADRAPDASTIGRRLENYWSKIKATQDLNEDAANYTGLGIVHCIELARMLGHEEELRGPGFRRMFERQRDTISPTGRLPEWGDAYFSLDRDAFDFLFLCEYAAAMYDDATFLTVARRLYDPQALAQAPPDQWGRGMDLLGQKLSTRQPAPLPAASLVNYRVNRQSAQAAVDKLILRTGSQPGDAMAFMDLYASGSHSHPSLGPSIAYYEADGAPLFHNLGRHGVSSAIAGNSFWAMETGTAFPGVWKPGEWFTMTIPEQYIFHDGPDDLTIGGGILLRNFPRRGTHQLSFDNLRLEGKAGVKLLDGFESEKQWDPAIARTRGVKVETSPDHTEGAASQCINWEMLKGTLYCRGLAGQFLTFKREQYDKIRIDVKYTGIHPCILLRGLCQEIELGDQTLIYSVGSARVEQRGSDAFGEAVFSRYIAPDARLTRRMVLTAEGCLVIHDRWSAGASQPAWNAGQLWQLYAIKDRGPDWFCSDDDGAFSYVDAKGAPRSVTRRMLVKFAVDPHTETFVEEIDQPCHIPTPKGRAMDKFFTTGSKRMVKANEEAAFTMVVVPHDPSRDAKNLAAGIHFNSRNDGVDVVLPPVATAPPVRVGFFNDGRWQVTRGK